MGQSRVRQAGRHEGSNGTIFVIAILAMISLASMVQLFMVESGTLAKKTTTGSLGVNRNLTFWHTQLLFQDPNLCTTQFQGLVFDPAASAPTYPIELTE